MLRKLVAATVLLGALIISSPNAAWAGSPGQNPAGCGTGDTWSFKDFNVNGAIMREELRHSYGCGAVGWGRLTHVGGSWPSLALIQSAWNPGQGSQGGVPNTNYTYTVNAASGQQVCAGFQAYWVDIYGRWHYINWFNAGCYAGN